MPTSFNGWSLEHILCVGSVSFNYSDTSQVLPFRGIIWPETNETKSRNISWCLAQRCWYNTSKYYASNPQCKGIFFELWFFPCFWFYLNKQIFILDRIHSNHWLQLLTKFQGCWSGEAGPPPQNLALPLLPPPPQIFRPWVQVF